MSPSSSNATGLVLGSASPRRRELLSVLVSGFEVDPAHIDERALDGESALDHVVRLAAEKARCVAVRHSGRTVLGADTVVVLDGVALGKPADDHEARSMLRALSGRWHTVHSAVTLVGPGEREWSAVSGTNVRFETLSADWIDAYIASGDPMDKAGAYAIQGAPAAWISRIEGSYSGVVGLPLYETAGLLRAAGLA